MKTTLKYACLSAVLVLSACSGDNDVKEKLGLKASPPDEFSVVTRAPLSVPPDFELRPPRPGAERPMELSVKDQAKQTVFGEADVKGASDDTSGEMTGANAGFLNKLGANTQNAEAREQLDTEMQTLDKKETPAAEKLLFWKDKEAPGKTIDPVEEQKRLEASGLSEPKLKDSKAKASSADGTDGDTDSSTVEKRNEDILQSE